MASNEVATAAKVGIPDAIAALQANPALNALLLGSVATYGKSAAAPVVGSALGWLVARYGLACAAGVTTGCWTPATVDTVTGALVAVGTALGAVVMHWLSKSPARAAAAMPAAPAAPAAAAVPATKTAT